MENTNETNDINDCVNEKLFSENGKEDISKNQDTTMSPSISVLHEDVKKYIESYVQQQGYNNVIINVEIGSNLGDNFLGFIGKLTVTGVDNNNETKTFNWIIKTAPNTEMYRTIFNVSVLYHREIYLYRNVLQIFRDFQREKQILEPFDQYPGFVLAYDENMKESILMEDMKHVGYTMRPRHETLDLNHVKLAMKTFAKLHAISYALKDQKPELFKNIAENTKDVMGETMLCENVRKLQAPTVENMYAALDPIKDSKTHPIFEKFLDNYPEILRNLLLDTNERSVIGHGDSWINNILWKYDEKNSNIPKKICVLDWQLARYCSPVCDLSYFLFSSTSKEFRDKHYDDLFKLYYYTLCAQVVELGTDPKIYLPFEALQEELKKYSLIGLFTTVLVLAIITREENEIPEWRSDDVNQEEVEAGWSKSSKNIHVYNEKVREVVNDFYEKGYFDNLMKMFCL